jgi:hypothetical protein
MIATNTTSAITMIGIEIGARGIKRNRRGCVWRGHLLIVPDRAALQASGQPGRKDTHSHHAHTEKTETQIQPGQLGLLLQARTRR